MHADFNGLYYFTNLALTLICDEFLTAFCSPAFVLLDASMPEESNERKYVLKNYHKYTLHKDFLVAECAVLRQRFETPQRGNFQWDLTLNGH